MILLLNPPSHRGYYLNSFLKIAKFIPAYLFLDMSLEKVSYPLLRDTCID